MSSLPHILRQLASLAEIRGLTHDSAALERAADIIAAISEDQASIIELARKNRLNDVEALRELDPQAIEVLHDIADSDALTVFRSALDLIPRDLRLLVESGGLPVPRLAELHRTVSVVTIGEFVRALAENRIPDPDVADALRDALRAVAQTVPRLPLGRAQDVLEEFIRSAHEGCDAIDEIIAVGSVRRYDATVGDLKVVVKANRASVAIDCLAELSLVDHVLHRREAAATLLIGHDDVQVRIASPADFALALFYETGSMAHVAQVTAHASGGGIALSRAQLVDAATGAPLPHATEEDIYRSVGLPFIPPELREGTGEVQAGAMGRLPQLVTRKDIRGDLHVHSNWSDGRDSLEAVIVAAQSLGYEYVAITDHSQSAGASRVLSEDRLRRQIDEIERLRERHQTIAILTGVEVDILPDGRLDFSDAILERVEVVLASLHDAAGQDGETLLNRYLATMAHPLVSVITHPMNRLVGRREGYPLDYDRLFEAAADTGTVLEIDGAPGHLDLDGAMARRAVAAGALVSIDSDCHRASTLDRQMRLGVMTARRGWVEPRHVVNTRPLEELRSLLRRKRSSG